MLLCFYQFKQSVGDMFVLHYMFTYMFNLLVWTRLTGWSTLFVNVHKLDLREKVIICELRRMTFYTLHNSSFKFISAQSVKKKSRALVPCLHYLWINNETNFLVKIVTQRSQSTDNKQPFINCSLFVVWCIASRSSVFFEEYSPLSAIHYARTTTKKKGVKETRNTNSV